MKTVMLLKDGSKDRDRFDRMVKHNKPPIINALDNIRVQYPNWDFHVLEPFPPLTVAKRID